MPRCSSDHSLGTLTQFEMAAQTSFRYCARSANSLIAIEIQSTFHQLYSTPSPLCQSRRDNPTLRLPTDPNHEMSIFILTQLHLLHWLPRPFR